MKKLAMLLIMVMAISQIFAQENIFKMDDKVVNAGIGFGSALYGSGYKSTFLPFSVSFEKCLKEGIAEKGSIGVGGYLAYSSYKWEYYDWGWKYTDFVIGPRGSFHYPLVDKLDTYSGLMLGYEIITSKEFGNTIPGYNYYSEKGGGFIWAWHAGARYYFTEKLAGMAELGYGVNYLTLGISYKL